jgi:hypothetical protein
MNNLQASKIVNQRQDKHLKYISTCNLQLVIVTHLLASYVYARPSEPPDEQGLCPIGTATASIQRSSTSQSTISSPLSSSGPAAFGFTVGEHSRLVLFHLRQLEGWVWLEARPRAEKEEAYIEGKEDKE